MHELAIAQSICSQVRPYTSAHQQITKVVVEYGPFCGVVPENLSDCFTISARHIFGYEDVALEMRLREANASCAVCQSRFTVATMWEPCPDCGHLPVTARGGRDLRVLQIEIEEDDHV